MKATEGKVQISLQTTAQNRHEVIVKFLRDRGA